MGRIVRGGKEIRIALSSLPEDAQIKYVNKTEEERLKGISSSAERTSWHSQEAEW